MSDPAPAARRFHLSDGIVLVAAAALVLTAERTVYRMWSRFSTWFSDVPSWNPAEVRRMAWSLALAEVSLVLLIPSLLRRADRGRLRRGRARPPRACGRRDRHGGSACRMGGPGGDRKPSSGAAELRRDRAGPWRRSTTSATTCGGTSWSRSGRPGSRWRSSGHGTPSGRGTTGWAGSWRSCGSASTWVPSRWRRCLEAKRQRFPSRRSIAQPPRKCSPGIRQWSIRSQLGHPARSMRRPEWASARAGHPDRCPGPSHPAGEPRAVNGHRPERFAEDVPEDAVDCGPASRPRRPRHSPPPRR